MICLGSLLFHTFSEGAFSATNSQETLVSFFKKPPLFLSLFESNPTPLSKVTTRPPVTASPLDERRGEVPTRSFSIYRPEAYFSYVGGKRRGRQQSLSPRGWQLLSKKENTLSPPGKRQERLPPSKDTKKDTKKVTARPLKNEQQSDKSKYTCLAILKGPHPVGVEVGLSPSARRELGMGVFTIERNRCEGNWLIRYSCDSTSPSLFSEKEDKVPQRLSCV